MAISILPFDIDSASREDFTEHHELALAAFAVDRPDAPLIDFETFVGRLRAIPPGVAGQRIWTAHDEGRLVGSVVVQLPRLENTRAAVVDIRVQPAMRRHGIGTKLLQVGTEGLREAGRDIVVGRGITAGGDGEGWANRLGFATVQKIVLQTLQVAESDYTRWEIAPPRGYLLVQWKGTAPDDLVESYAGARNSIRDAPAGESGYQHPVWTVERVRHAEDDARNRGVEHRVSVIVHQESKAVVALTVLEAFPHLRTTAFQQDTVVVPGHRGRGLGRCVKSAMMRWLTAERPEIGLVVTNTAADNNFMIQVNHDVGYLTRRTMLTVEADLTDLESRWADGRAYR
ncbi:GNAT family N-acetyltransferase [Nonomuraea sp. SMC257]|uniref:GNAT family N-acetyltransferase n=1 Tax=Nonomuraea montanisoli TaxID=2741721 RepID=A0A7Y6M5E7_9ACTN|nr:GNAT family N-acetyltransferase [Nonomuraea montanisoli]NUW34561.1 GNAT family N-acetyltransferase [Nonomuraea montanisoli]